MINLSPLLRLFNQIQSYNDLADALYAKATDADTTRSLGVLTGARPALVASLQKELHRPILFITARADRARIMMEQIQIWTEDPDTVYRLPDPDALPFEKVPWGNETTQARLAALASLMLYQQRREADSGTPPPVIIASARALMQSTIPVGEFTMIELHVGQRIDLNATIRQWIDLGYRSEEVVEVPGSFSRRGGILDIFPTNGFAPVRIELFGDEIDSLRTFDPTTQRSEGRLKECLIAPASEALPRYAERAMQQLNAWEIDNLQPSAKMAFEEDIARLAAATTFRGSEYYLPFFYNDYRDNTQSTSYHTALFSYLPADTQILIEDPDELASVVVELDAQAQAFKRDLTSVGDLPTEWIDPYFDWDALRMMLADFNPASLGFTDFAALSSPAVNGHGDHSTETNDTLSSGHILQPVLSAAPAFGGQVKNVIEDIIKRKQRGERVVLVSRQAKRLSSLLEEAEQTVTPLDTLQAGDPPPPSGSITLLQGMLIEGWTLQQAKSGQQNALLTLLSDSEIFGWKKPTTVRRRKTPRGVTPETFFADVNPGDMVVHIEHGIGRYVGLVKLDFEGVEREYLSVEYANGDKLYVPIHQADRLARYVGADENPPLLNRLGSADWNTVKRRTKKAVEDIAKDLLEIYAKRETAPGRAYKADTEWQTEIEDAFPFVETDDQLRAIDEVKRDMEKARPMDRLICGDVGYGKTEVALRAAFKAVMDDVQVAVLAPTTVLAQQHYNTFLRRMEGYPVQIEVLSRFRTKQQQERALTGLATGTVDIVIGTHRLLQKDVGFKNLGLVIIDEEQRFGVKQKERFRQLRTEIDVLTLTATPIPRTLNMSLSGVRDLSTIDTPPEERLPIQTTISEYDEPLIRQAVMRELDRGGQIFYVYNRVMGIEQKANRLRNIVPESRVIVAHGQMSTRQLEQVMVAFINGEYDILVSTTIVESGLDMPNVNTIIIDRADRMGLAQLYQLRGRVGRGAVQAYAYLLTPKHSELKPDAHKRLEAIAEASELGAGFRIAMRDLEIRGAGELLGAKQHGHIGAVGFDLYSRLLAQAISELKGEVPQQLMGRADEASAYLNPLADGIQLNLPIPAYVPEDYLPEEKLRLRLYRRLAGVTTLPGIDEMAKELEDRFGDLPEPLANLLYQLRLKILAMEASVKAIITESGQIIIRSDALQAIDRPNLMRRLNPAAKVTPRQISLPLHPNAEVWQEELEKSLRLLGRMLHDPAG